MNSGLQPLIDQAPLVLYLSAPEILLSAAMIYDALSRGSLDWLQPLHPPSSSKAGAQSAATNVKPGAESVFSDTLPLSQNYFIITSYWAEYGFQACIQEQSHESSFKHHRLMWVGTNIKKGTFVRFGLHHIPEMELGHKGNEGRVAWLLWELPFWLVVKAN